MMNHVNLLWRMIVSDGISLLVPSVFGTYDVVYWHVLYLVRLYLSTNTTNLRMGGGRSMSLRAQRLYGSEQWRAAAMAACPRRHASLRCRVCPEVLPPLSHA